MSVSASSATVPGAPSGVRATPGHEAVTVSWETPGNGGSPITEYTVTPIRNGAEGRPISVRGNPPATRVTVWQLSSQDGYSFKVAAVNGIGSGPVSTPTEAVIPSQPGLPPAVRNTRAIGGSRSAKVSWTPPDDDMPPGAEHGRITQYVVTPNRDAKAVRVADQPLPTFAIVPRLRNWRRYEFTVAAVNEGGPGHVSSVKATPLPWRRLDGQGPTLGAVVAGLAIVLLVIAIGVQANVSARRWDEASSTDNDYGFTIALLSAAFVCALLWIAQGFSERREAGQVSALKSRAQRRRRVLYRCVVVEGVAGLVLFAIWTYAVLGPAHHFFLWFPGRVNFVWTQTWSALTAAAIVVVGLFFAHGVSRLSSSAVHPADFEPDPNSPDPAADRRANAIAFRTAGLKGVVVGADGLASTSRLMPALWSVALLFAIILLLLVGRTPHCPNPPGNSFANPPGVTGSCPFGSLKLGTGSFSDDLGKNFPWDYLLLLGFPVAAAMTAKWQAMSFGERLRAPSMDQASKPSPEKPEHTGITAGLSQVISNDAGQASLVNAQYLAFTLATIVFFLVQVTSHPSHGLPLIPAALLVLSGVAVCGYVANRQIVGMTTPKGDDTGGGN